MCDRQIADARVKLFAVGCAKPSPRYLYRCVILMSGVQNPVIESAVLVR
ncbi:hypothetical protein C4J97_3453 [Pseudomonas orientalis]|nr:hypothetical protein C4J97_3453 [Pseudomonas orientalis]